MARPAQQEPAMSDAKQTTAALFAASMVTPQPVRDGPPAPRKPSGKNRDKVKAARKQRRKSK